MTRTWKLSLASIGAAALFSAGILVGANSARQPHTLMHVVTIEWNEGTTDAQKQAVYDGVVKMASEIEGIRNVWVKPVKVQPSNYTGAFAMEFDSKEALDAYAKNSNHDAWMKVYAPVHKESRTHDITN